MKMMKNKAIQIDVEFDAGPFAYIRIHREICNLTWKQRLLVLLRGRIDIVVSTARKMPKNCRCVFENER